MGVCLWLRALGRPVSSRVSASLAPLCPLRHITPLKLGILACELSASTCVAARGSRWLGGSKARALWPGLSASTPSTSPDPSLQFLGLSGCAWV